MRFDLALTGVGAVTPVGLSAPATCAALRAGIARLLGFEDYEVAGGDVPSRPVAAGRVPTEWFTGGPVEEEWPGHERFAAPIPIPQHVHVPAGSERLSLLAGHAAREALAAARVADAADARLGLYLGLDEADDGDGVAGALRPALPSAPSIVRTYRSGRGAGLLALAHAARHLSAGRVDAALVGGVDSLLRHDVLSRLDAAGRLKSAAAPDGFLPGEAAAFVVLERPDAARARGIAPLARLAAAATAEEPTAGTGDPCQGQGLTAALRTVIEEVGTDQGCLVVCDLNGERLRALEWALVNARLSHTVRGFVDLWHPADCVGDTGAASGILSAVWAATALRKGYAAPSHVLLWGASDGPARAAAWLEPARGE
jgi:3-oxoacyl-[acyl-carrier-protein] synthase-1